MERIDIAGIVLDVDIVGEGPPMLYLHPEHYAHLHASFVDKLAKRWKIYAPRHPGFDGQNPPENFRRVEDIAYLYLDLVERLGLGSVTMLGASFGGWIALEMAVRNSTRLNALGLIAPLGVKLGSREERDFEDIFALSDEDAARALFAVEPPDLNAFSDDQLTAVARDRQFVCYYAWKPFLHNPSLARWLHRVAVPTHLIWGENDGFVRRAHGQKLAARIPGARLDVIPGAGHYPQLERLDETVELIFAGPCAKAGAKQGG
ncbi:MAG: alpha/beta hydrolase [Alphaproteobacteria bacterium]|nr:alpha/beta hydrolase [Alphaproteobacteria bacterium]